MQSIYCQCLCVPGTVHGPKVTVVNKKDAILIPKEMSGCVIRDE